MTAGLGTRSDILGQVFRSNPTYEFVPFRRFVGVERELIADLSRDVEVCGVLRARTSATLGVKAATRTLASLFRTRRSPGPIPPRFRGPDSDRSLVDEITRLVLDGILEVERDGHFVSGAGADHLLIDAAQPRDSDDPLQALSSAAVRYGEALDIASPASLSARIYFYNRLPVTPRSAHRLPTRSAVLEFLGLSDGSELRRVVDAEWASAPAGDKHGWLSWNPRARSAHRSNDAPMLKIYVSPMPGEMRDALAMVVRTLVQCAPSAFKVGDDIHGLFRPDKLVVYLTNQSEFDEVADHLARSLNGMSPHGVPFTASIDGTGLLSRGLDPPRTIKILSWSETESWRVWVTNRLAVYLLTARATRTDASTLTGAQFAAARLRLEGVDTQQWAPDAIAWAQQPTGAR